MKQVFIETVAQKDIVGLRACIKSEIIEDPTFSTTNVQECLDYIEKSGVNIYEEYAPTPCETVVPEDESKWDKILFFDKVEDLRLNFAFKERIGDIKRIGRRVFKNEVAAPAASFEEAPKSHRSEEKTKWLPIAIGVAAVVVAIVLILIKNR